ncbi:MAG: hypothetical protein DSZ30_01885 [Aquificaceae bacterium]|nr:MAG: hypothetical protein DSZ30_01885 [Aquificaceae bacterium]
MKPALVIAGLDPSGGAGILLDIKVFSFFKIPTAGVITANTVQNSCGAFGYEVTDGKLFAEQLLKLKEDFSFGVIKVGMLAKGEFLELTLSTFEGVNAVVDPVMYSKNGKPLVDNPLIYKTLAERIFLITPNLEEAKILTETETDDPLKLGKLLKELGFKNVLLKGGHLQDPKKVRDYLFTEDGEILTFERKRVDKTPRGTGCLISSAIAALYLKTGDLKSAFFKAEEFVGKVLEKALKLGKCYEILTF